MPKVNETISHYRIIEKLGEGGMGVVYKAEDTKLKRIVALKFLPPELTSNPEIKRRFIHEAQAASVLQHTNICTIHEIDETNDGQMFICMDYYEGMSLHSKIKASAEQNRSDQRLKIHEAIEYTIQIAKGLKRAHEAGIVHRDIKSANIMITNHEEVKIIDFGLARLAGQTKLTKDSSTLGTIDYMSPEQAQGNPIDHRTDIWSFGIVLYEMLCGKRPFTGEYDQAVIYSIINEQPLQLEDLRNDIPSELINIIHRCLMKNPDDRYNSIKEIICILEQYNQETNTTGHIYKPFPLNKNMKGLKRSLLSGTILIVIILGWFIWIMFFSLPGEKHVAVLPLTNIGEDEKNKIYCDGLLEIITSRLTQLQQYQGSMWVIPSSEIRRYKITSAEEAYKKFNANLVVTGSIEKRLGYVQLILNLVDAKTFRQLKSEDLKIDENDISYKLEEEVIDKIIEMLELHLHPTIRADFFTGGTPLPDVYDYYVQGRGYLQRYEDQNNIDTSIRLFKQALNADSTFTLALAGLGEAYWRKFEATKDIIYVEPAMATCKLAIKQNDRYADVYVTCGMINIGIGEYEKAVQELKRALKIDSLNGVAYWKLGHAYQLIGDSAAALKTYQKAIEKRPGSWQGYSHLGYFYLINGNYQKAIEPYEKVVELLPHSDLGYNKLAATYFYMDRFSEAIQMSKRALENNPSYPTRHNLASFYYYAGDFDRAVKIYHQVLQQNNKDYRIWGSLATSYYFTNRPDSASICYQKAVKMAEGQLRVNPKDHELLAYLAGYYARLVERDKAFGLLENVVVLKPTNLDVIFDIRDVFEQLGEREKALEWMEKAIMNNYKLTKFTNNPGLKDLIADERFPKLIDKYRSLK